MLNFHKIKSMVIGLGVSLAVFAISAQASAGDDLANILNATQAMRANFTQTVYDNHGKAIQKTYGYMALQRPGKFRWEVKKPIPQVIIANQSRLWIYDPDLEQVTIRSLHTAAGETPALLLSHVDNVLDHDYVIKQAPAKDGLNWFTLIPRNADNMFASIKMAFAQSQIREMDLQDHLGHTTKIKFENAVVNSALSASLFVFKKPANVDVIDETRKR